MAIPRCDANPSTSKYRWNQDHEDSFLLEVTTTFRLPLNIVDLLGQTSCFKFKTTTPTMSMTFDRCCANLVESLKAQLQAKLYRVKETMGRMYSWTYAYQVHWGFINNLQAATKKDPQGLSSNMMEKSGRAEKYGRMAQRRSIHFFFGHYLSETPVGEERWN